ncbi:RNA 3'-terminal phosphate cyclase domain-containing protein [Phaeosphaeria sp. MPI-PUGE-AT-0046c]|nr:RNA 3'-terminal phosphate cyclase domain-containing protein [Phaeosphaeria sp. MPI-PUGE-AT-0046c]
MAPKMKLPAPIHLKGTTLEGGGQLVRIALGLSSLTRKPINITNIRGKRSGGGGLKAQHLTCVQWLGKACEARLSGVGLKAKEITFTPKQINDGTTFNLDEQGGEIRIMQNTPGSINMILQAILPYVLFSGASSPIRITITGGTNVSNSPSYDYILEVLIPMVTLIGIPPITARVTSRGWSQGTTRVGSATYTVTPLASPLPAFTLTSRGGIVHIKAIVIAPRETEQDFRDELDCMFDKRAARFLSTLSSAADTIEVTFEPSHHEKRYYLLLVATSSTGIKLGRDWLYDMAIRPGRLERIVPTMVKRVADELLSEIEHGGCVDEFMRDQVVVYQGLAAGKSAVDGGRRGDGDGGGMVEASLHATTAMWVVREMLGVEFDGEGGCVGVGFRPGGGRSGDGDGSGELVDGVEKLELDAR